MAAYVGVCAILRDAPLALLSDCVGRQAFCHFLLSLRIALRTVRSFRATAMRATICGFPASRRRWWKARRAGLQRIFFFADMNSAVRTILRPPPMKLLPRHLPD